MSVRAQRAGGSGGSRGEAGFSARRRWATTQAGAPSRPAQAAAQRGLKVRNALTALAIGAVVAGIYGYTFYSVSQEHFLDELELEAKAARAQAAKTSAN
ncbi:cytochrome c oxidase assembly factor 3 homolog, mitochondrial [Heteronotia binoei]|uniref:cytochrome c oxidase assembly factor 3 homolog, mitochondrial n=1 Tax=Heteronotia binoei TaxID=13085 RepID=UPI00292E4F87|nr:cytochrome c oxidase assembly factor 3 homolog, mitochondrial [Heteronotia binoei]